jgi:FMN phosphatase YigB (HAD superfamily)
MYNSIDLTKDKEEYFKLLAFKEKQLKNMKIDKYIDKLILSHKYFGFKPQKKVFEKLLHELNAKPQECIMIGDSYNDMGATQLNIFSILMSKKKCKEFTPNYIVNSFDEISKIIDFETCELKI